VLILLARLPGLASDRRGGQDIHHFSFVIVIIITIIIIIISIILSLLWSCVAELLGSGVFPPSEFVLPRTGAPS
jgi:hypothetical protein